MRLMIIGALDGHISEAGKMALKRGAKVAHCENIEQALTALRGGKGADLIMIDVKQDISTFIDQLTSERIATEVVACGIGTDSKAAVDAIKSGAKEYVPLPPNAELIAAVLEAVTNDDHFMIADAAAIQDIISIADQVADSSASVLISGESGTGKELMARYIHNKSNRKNNPFISLNCAAIPETLLESEMFGHEKGAFTGAVSRRLGKFEEASGGTLFLDEISEMDIALQAKLLRAIQEKEITRVGSNNAVKVDMRLIATTNRDLEKEAKAGTFREDLYFRLNVINLHLPPLRERVEDIAKLADFFAKKYAKQNNVNLKVLSDEAIAKLQSYHWPGNIRELENCIHRAVLIAREDSIEPENLALTGQSTAVEKASEVSHQAQGAKANSSVLVGKTVAEVERDLILSTLDHTLGNRTHAANILGISIRTLRNKINLYAKEGINIPEAQQG